MTNIENLMDQEVITQVIDPKELENMSVQDLIDKKYITRNIEMFDTESPVEPEEEETPSETTDENEGTEDEGVENETSKEEETPSESVEDDDAPVIDEETEE